MRRLGIFWLLHFAATVGGWYLLGALAQGAVDSEAGATMPLAVLNVIMQILCFPVVTIVMSAVSGLGSFSMGSFIAFAAVAALNSAVVVAVLTALLRSLRAARIDPPGNGYSR